MEAEIKGIIRILRRIKELMDVKGTNVLFSSFNTNIEIIESIETHINMLNNYDFSVLDELILLFLPTSDLQELSISNGWSEEYLELSKQFDSLIQLITKNK
jgi:hypothetical protein